MNLTDKICQYATLAEVTQSHIAMQLYGTDNMPTPEHLENLKLSLIHI